MNCTKLETILIPYLDGRASERERHEVDLHLIACSACRTRVEEFRRVSALLDEAPVVQPSLAFDARLRQRLAAEPVPGLFGWLAPLRRPALAFAMLAVFSVWIGMLPTNPEIRMVQSEEDFRMIRDLSVLEDYDVLANFEALSELPPVPVSQQKM